MSFSKLFWLLPSALFLFVICSCSNENVSRIDAAFPNISVSSRISPDNSLIVFLDVTSVADSSVYVEYGNKNIGYFKTPTTESDKNHSIPIVRLRASTKYNYRVKSIDDKGVDRTMFSGSFISGPLPDDLKLGFKSIGKPSFNLTLMDINLNVAKKSYVVILDKEGEIVWYHPSSEGVFTLNAIKQKQNFNIVYNVPGQGIFEINFLGQLINQLPTSPMNDSHHDFLISNDNSIIFLSGRTTFDSKVPLHLSVIREWNESTNETKTLWDPLSYEDANSIIDSIYLDIERKKPDDHSNSLFIGKEGNILLSRRHTNEVLSLAPEWGEIQWTLGGPHSDFKFESPLDKFYGQHTAVETKNGTLLLFDNGYGRPDSEGGQYSRAIEFKLDFEHKLAKKMWEYRPDENIFTPSRGGLERLDNGDTLINFGTSNTIEPTYLIEVNEKGNVVWKLESSPDIPVDRYRATTLKSISGETRVR